MYVKHLIGARKGEIEDLPFENARDKVYRGEAEDVYSQLPARKTSVPQPKVVSNRADVTVTKVEHATQKARRK